MSDLLQHLVKRYQAGENVRGEIEIEIIKEEVTENLINDNSYLDGLDGDQRIYNNSLDYALSNYSPDKNMKFVNYLKMAYLSRLINEYDKAKIEHANGVTIRSIEAYDQAGKDLVGSPVDHAILKKTVIFDDEILNQLKPQEKDYIAIYLTFAARNKTLTDETAAQVLNRTGRTVINYRKNIKKLLSEHGSYNEHHEKIEQNKKGLSLYNEYGIKDPTPYEAMKRMK